MKLSIRRFKKGGEDTRNKRLLNIAAVILLINTCVFSMAGMYYVMSEAGISQDIYMIPVLWLTLYWRQESTSMMYPNVWGTQTVYLKGKIY